MTKNINKVFIIATEQSGDNIGYNLILELLKINFKIKFYGIGGSKMLSLMDKQFFSIKDFKSIGIIEILFSLTKYLKIISFLNNNILKYNYDLIITIDSPDFNYPLVKKLRNNNFKNKIIQIVAPSVWAWRKYRAKNFAKVFDELFVLFEFEIQYFIKYNLKTTLIGHPIYYIKNNNYEKIKKDCIAFLPGSRVGELEKLLPYFKFAHDYLLKNFSDIIIFIPKLTHLENIIKDYVKNWKMKINIITDNAEIEKYYLRSSKALVCSGTASLEIAKRNIPQLVIYKLNFLTEFIMKFFISIKYANIINIFENTEIIPEITNSNLNKKTFIKKFSKLIIDNHSNIIQIKNIKSSLKKIQRSEPPFLIAAKHINRYLD